MSAKPFFDTNVLLYLLASDAKADRAEELLDSGGVISVQVLNEFASVASRKLKMAWPEIREVLATIRTICEIVPLTGEVHDAGLAIADRHQLSFYDSLIVAAATLYGCRTIYSEDMGHGEKIGNVTITNPF